METKQQIDHGMFRFRLPSEQIAARRMRRHLEELDYDFDPEVVELLKLVATELITNAVIHSGAGEEIVVFVRVREPTLLLKVCDPGPGLKSERTTPANVMSEGGRGLFLVEAMSRSWGTSRVDIDGEDWACVWACFGEDALPCKETG